MQLIRFVFFSAFWAIWFLFIQSAVSQVQPTFEHILPTEDLSTPSTTAIIQDESGYIWIGSTNGLNRFNGREVEQYFFDPADSLSISNNFVNYDALYEHNGFIWIGTENGLNKFDPDTGQFTRFHNIPDDPGSICGDVVNAILATDESTLWIGSRTGVCKLDLLTMSFQSFYHDPTDVSSLSFNAVTSLAQDADGQLWIGTRNGLNLFQPDDQNFIRFLYQAPPASPNLLAHVSTLHVDKDYLWIGTSSGGLLNLHLVTRAITSYRHNISDKHSLSSDIVTDILTDNKDRLWVATFGGGICEYSREKDNFRCLQHAPKNPASLIDDQAIGLIEDYEGSLWVTTWNGVSKMNRNLGFSSLTFSPNNLSALAEPRVNAIYEDYDGTIWLGGITSGLSRLNPETGSIKHFYHDPSDPSSLSFNEVWSITGNEEALWVGTSAGLNKFDRRSEQFTRFFNASDNPKSLSENRTYSVFMDMNDTLWVTTPRQGINKLIDSRNGLFDRYTATQQEGALSSNDVWPVFQSINGLMWFGTLENGLNKFDAEENWFTSYQYTAENHSISSNMVLHITGDKHDNLWLGTMRGLNKFDQTTEKFHVFTEDNGLANNEVSCVLTDDERLWIGTRNGLSLFDIKEQTFLNFYMQNGMSSTGFLAGACIKSISGKFYFGSDNGLISFFPDSIDLDIPPPRLAFSDVRINNVRSVKELDKKGIDLPFKENTLSFRISALTYSGAEKNQLYYRMTGLDTTWLPVESSSLITFTTLPANDYTLEVKGKNSFGVYNERPLKLEITINPPYWDTWWFRLLAGFLALSIIAAIFRTRVNFLLATEREAVKIEKLRTELAADFHDNIGTGLGHVGLNIDNIANHEDTPAPVRDKLLLLRESIKNLSDMRREIGWIINPENDSIGKLADRIIDVAYDMIPSNMLSITIAPDLPDKTLTMDTRRHLLHFVKEALSNALRHAQASHIQLSINSIKDVCTITIMDNGIGFDPDNLENKNGEGLKTMDYRATEVGGNLQIKRGKAGGTVVQLDIK
ncbi:MAG: two-component regulator propeller domain-containing protein [Rhodothermales bacterium]